MKLMKIFLTEYHETESNSMHLDILRFTTFRPGIWLDAADSERIFQEPSIN